MRRFFASSLAFVLAANGQQIGQNNTSPTGPVTFQASTALVVETVSVKDKSGKPVEGLTAKDFTITEDGVAQTIKFFEYQRFEEPGDAPPPPLPPPRAVEALKKIPSTQIAPETPGQVKYRDKRLLAMYFDLTAMPVPDQLRAIDAGRKFIRTQMTGSDLMAIMIYSG